MLLSPFETLSYKNVRYGYQISIFYLSKRTKIFVTVPSLSWPFCDSIWLPELTIFQWNVQDLNKKIEFTYVILAEKEEGKENKLQGSFEHGNAKARTFVSFVKLCPNHRAYEPYSVTLTISCHP